MSLKVFSVNHEVRFRRIVAAERAGDAARLLGCSLGFLNRRGTVCTVPEDVAVAMSAPGVVFQRRLSLGGEWERMVA
jgi:hypothetical protein